MYTQYISGCLSILLLSSTLTSSYPQLNSGQIAAQYLPKPQHTSNVHHQSSQNQLNSQPPHYQQIAKHASHDDRKFAEKPNALKKVALDDIDEDIQTNQIQDSAFSWTNMIGSLMQMFFANANMPGPNKSEDFDTTNSIAASPWANVVTVGLKIITTLLGGGNGAVNDGIDKIDNGGGGSPMQNILAAVLGGVLGSKDPDQVNSMAKQAGEFINIVINLLDALKTSFSHRSLAARSIGKKDSVSDFCVATISMVKGYVKTSANSIDKCGQKYLCQANKECNNDTGGNSIFCQLGSYATSYALGKTVDTPFESLYEAGRRGRSGDICEQIYADCKEL